MRCSSASGPIGSATPEVRDVGMTFGEKHVSGLHVAVHHALSVGEVQAVGYFADDLQCFGQREQPVAIDPVPHRFPVDIRHDVVEEIFHLPRVEHREDARVSEAGGELDFTQEPVRTDGSRHLGQEHLEGHVPLVTQVPGAVDDGHPAAPDLLLEPVAVAQRCVQSVASVHSAAPNELGGRPMRTA